MAVNHEDGPDGEAIPMEARLRVIVIEDQRPAAERAVRQLEQSGFTVEWTQVRTEGEFSRELARGPDVILAEYELANFEAGRALSILQDRGCDVPLILVYDNHDEETVAASIRQGASDYLRKSQLARLGEVVRRALADRKLRTEKQESEVLLKEREAQYRALVEQSLAGIYLIVDGKFAYFNQAGAAIFGYQPEEIIGKLGPGDLTYPGDRARVITHIQQRLEGEIDSIRYRFRGLTKGGEIVDAEVHGRVVSHQGKPAILGTLVDVSEQVRSRREIELMLTVTEAVGSAGDFDAGLALALQKVCQSTGWSYGESWIPDEQGALVAGPSWHDGSVDFEEFSAASQPLSFQLGEGLPGRVWAEKAAVWIRDVRHSEDLDLQRRALAVEAGLKAACGVPIVSDGSVLAVLVFLLAKPQLQEERMVELVSGVAAQIGTIVRQKRMETALRESEERFRRLSENAQDIIMRLNLAPKPRFAYVSPAAGDILGYSPEEFYQDPDLLLRLTDPKDKPLLTAIVEARSLPADRLELRLNDRTGERVWMELTIVPVEKNGSLTAVEVIGRDVTQRKTAEGRIRAQVERLDALRKIDTAISGSMDLRVTFNVLLDQVINRLNVDAAVILIHESAAQRLIYGAGRGFKTRALRHTNLRLGAGLAGRAALGREPIFVPDLWNTDEEILSVPGMREEGFASYVGVPLVARGQVRGVLEVFHRHRLSPDDSWWEFLEALAGQAAIAIDNASLFDELQRFNAELTRAYDATIEGWARALELRDLETQGHTNRVTSVTMRLAASVGLPQRELVHLQRGALLHDIGKMGIPDQILLKPDKLTEAEWQEMKQHPVYAFQMLSPVAYLRPALDIPYCHHEKWDGTGYPRGLRGREIPLPARLFSIVDVWDALRSDRPYRRAWDDERVVSHLESQRGKHFDPEIADEFLALEPELRQLASALDLRLGA